MISWIQRSFQQHFRAVFAVLLAVTIISFIATIGAAPGIGNGERRITEQDFYGHNLANSADVGTIMRDGNASLELHAPQQYLYATDDERREYAFSRIVALALADRWHLPAPAEQSTQVVDYIERLPRFAGADGKFSPEYYAAWRSRLREAGGYAEQEYTRIITDDMRIQRVELLLGGPGYVLPADVMNRLATMDTTWTVSTASVDYGKFKGPATIEPGALAKFFAANAAKYTIPPRVSIGYVDFPAKDYVNQVEVSPAEVRAYYERNRAQFPAPKAPTPLVTKPTADSDFAAVEPKVEAALKLERATNQAMKAASDFSYALYQAKVTPGPTLDSFLQAHQVTEKSLPPFTADAVPAALGTSQDVGSAAFALTAEHYFSEATSTPSGAIVMLWKGNEAARQPLLTEVRARVETDYLADEKQKAFDALGAKLKADIAARLKAGLALDKAAAAAGSAADVAVAVKAIPPFKLSDQHPGLPPSLLQIVDSLTPGQISDLTMEAGQGVLVYDQGRKLPDPKTATVELGRLRAQEAMYVSHVTANQVLAEIVSAKLKDTPLDRE